MDKDTERIIQHEGAAALLDRGVSVPLRVIRIPFIKRPIKLRVTMRRPRLGGLMRLAQVYMSLGTTAAQIKQFTKEEEMAFIALHGKKISRMIAYTLCRGWWSRHFLIGFTSWWIRNWMEKEYLDAVMQNFIMLLGTDPFTSIIRSAEKMNPMKVRLKLSQRTKGS